MLLVLVHKLACIACWSVKSYGFDSMFKTAGPAFTGKWDPWVPEPEAKIKYLHWIFTLIWIYWFIFGFLVKAQTDLNSSCVVEDSLEFSIFWVLGSQSQDDTQRVHRYQWCLRSVQTSEPLLQSASYLPPWRGQCVCSRDWDWAPRAQYLFLPCRVWQALFKFKVLLLSESQGQRCV